MLSKVSVYPTCTSREGKGRVMYLFQALYVEWGSTNTTDTSVFMMKISHILKCEGK